MSRSASETSHDAGPVRECGAVTDLRTLRLVEYRPRDVRLRRADVDFLLSACRGTIEVVPTLVRGRYRMTATGHVGVMHAPGLRIVIRPKVPAANVFHLLDPARPPETVADSAGTAPGTEAIDYLTGRLAGLMTSQAAGGLRRSYVEVADRQPFLQGHLDVAAQARESPAGRDRFHVTRDEFTADTSFNRLTKATAETLLSSPFLGPVARTALQSSLGGYAEVSSVRLDRSLFDALPSNQLDALDRNLFDLCRMLANSLRPTDAAGATSSPGFLIDMAKVFEAYVGRGLSDRLPTGSVESQRSFCYHGTVTADQPPLTGRPDFVVRRAGLATCVLDAKWKPLDGGPPPDDVQQALAYATGLGCRDVRLVYAGRRDRTWRYELTASDVVLTIHTLRVVGPRERCERSLGRLAGALPH